MGLKRECSSQARLILFFFEDIFFYVTGICKCNRQKFEVLKIQRLEDILLIMLTLTHCDGIQRFITLEKFDASYGHLNFLEHIIPLFA